MDIVTSTLLSLSTWIVTFLVYRHNMNKDKSSLMLEMNKELSKERDNKLVIEYLFSVIYRVNGTDCSDIEFLVKHPFPQKAIANYLSVQRYIPALSFVDKNGSIGVVVAEGWRRGWKRNIKQVSYVAVILVMLWFTSIFSDLSYNYLTKVFNSDLASIINNSGLVSFFLNILINIAIPIMFSLVVYIAFRGLYSSIMIDVTAKFLDQKHSN